MPAISLEGDANGAPHPEQAAYAHKFVGPSKHRLITAGIGHKLPKEAPAGLAASVARVRELAQH